MPPDVFFSSHAVTAEFNHQLVQSASLVLRSPLHHKSIHGIAVQLQSVLGVPRLGGGGGGGRHGVGREAVRLRPVQLRLQTRQFPAQPQAHAQNWRLQVGFTLCFTLIFVRKCFLKSPNGRLSATDVTSATSLTPTTCPCATTCESTVRNATCATCAGRPSA